MLCLRYSNTPANAGVNFMSKISKEIAENLVHNWLLRQYPENASEKFTLDSLIDLKNEITISLDISWNAGYADCEAMKFMQRIVKIEELEDK